MEPKRGLSRRAFLKRIVGAGVAVGAAVPALGIPALVTADSRRPGIPSGIAAGDVVGDQAVIWSRTDRPARMVVEVATSDHFTNVRRIAGPLAQAAGDYTAKLNLTGLPSGQQIFYRVSFQDPKDARAVSPALTGRFRTPPAERRDISFVWGADTVGQGWGINPDWGGMRLYGTMGWYEPDFFLHSGDTIYADNPLRPEVRLADGGVWKNIVTEAKSKVAETLDEFRGNFAYNMLDRHLRHFHSTVPLIAQWDDHEVVNNWWPGQLLEDSRYTVKDVSLLAARARQAFFEYMPLRGDSIYRTIGYGPSLDVFVLDMRGYRAPNGPNQEPEREPSADLLGRAQIRWLKQALLASNATWKVIAADMPLGLVIFDNFVTRAGSEAVANSDGPPLGRELELADLLRFIKHNQIRNVVWLTGDVHYAAAHYYDPDRAQFQDFDPFYEFVAGPLNAGTFGPNELDNTFGPQVLYQRVPPEGLVNLPPSAGMQFFGQVQIDGRSEALTVTLRDLGGGALYRHVLEPA